MLSVKSVLLFSTLSFLAFPQGCPNNQVAFGGACFDSCPQNTVRANRRGTFQCEECDITNFFVISKDQSRCECALQTYYIAAWDQCAPCDYTCLTCSGPSSGQCLTCESFSEITFRKKNGGSCLCLPGYIDNGVSLKCDKCHQDCLTCSGPTETDCIECANKRVKNDVSQCVCANSFVSDDLGNCTCPPPLSVGRDGICKNQATSCGFNEQPSSTKIRSVASAAKGSSGACVCKAGTVNNKGKCEACKTNQVYNTKKKRCQCDSKGFQKKGNCIICPANQTYNKRAGECECRKNTQKTETGACISCPPKSIYSQGACNCVFNYYFAQNGKCKKCTKNTDNPACQQNVDNIDKPRRLERSQI